MPSTHELPQSETAGRRLISRRPLAVAFAISLLPAFYIARFGSWTAPDGQHHQSLFDDAMISMSYARTLASGHGLVWFPGAPRVEGITNLGWTLVMAGVHLVGLDGDGAVVAVKVLGLLTVWLAAVVACSIGRTFRGADMGSTRFVTALAVVINVPLLFWALEGMEVGLLTLLTLLTCLLTWRVATCTEASVGESLALGAVVVMGIITRTDFAVVALAAFAWAAVAAKRELGRVALPLLGGVVLAVVGTTIFRLAYFGDLLPNTYYLKLTGVPVATRLGRGVSVVVATSLAYIGPSLAVVALLWKRLLSRERRLVSMLFTVAAGQILYCVYVGGDAWEGLMLPDRYLTPAVVLVVVSACLSAFAAFAHEPATASPDRRWRMVSGIAISAAAGPLVVAGLLYLAGRVTSLGLGDGSRAVGLKAAVLALIVCAALVGGAYALTAQHRLRVGSALAAATTLCLLAGLATILLVTTPEWRDGGSSQFAVLGSQLADVTTTHAVIAVGGAGASQYFSNRPMIDLAGKSDRHIARGPAATDVFRPGHNKWDFAYSVGRLRPDVVAQPPHASDTELRALGYVPMRLRQGRFSAAISYDGESVVYVRSNSPNVLFDRLVPVDP